MEIVKIKLADLEPNTGQIPGLPMNPRQWTASEVDRIANSLQETPELFEARPLLVYPLDKKFIILGGNLRHEGAKRNKMKEAPCIVFPADTPIEKLKEIVIKDNGSFGEWDFDALANNWDDLPLADWGIPAPDVEAEVEKAMKDEEVAAKVPFSEVLGEEHNYVVLFFDNDVDWLQAQTLLGLEPVKAWPTKRSEENSGKFKRIGVGRVLNGPKAIEKIMAYKG